MAADATIEVLAPSAPGRAPSPAGERQPPPSVGLLTWDFPVISETFVVEQAAGLRARGVDLRVLAAAPRPEGDPATFDAAARLFAERRVSRPDPTLAPTRALRRAAARSPARLARLAAALAAQPAQARATLAQAAAFGAVPPLDILHCQFATLGLLALRHRRIGSLRFRRLVVHLRGYDVTKFVAERGPGVYAELFRRGDLFVANCAHFARRAEELGCDPARITVIGSPVDMERFTPAAPRDAALRDASPGASGAPPRIAAVGRLVEKKGFEDAVRAVGLLRDGGRRVAFDVIGDGPLRGRLEALIAELDLREQIRLLGAGTQSAVAALLHDSDLLIAPSVRAASGDEDAPVNTIKEAMATGLPVVATRHGGIPELVEDGVNGLLAPERDPVALARAIARLLDAPPEARATMGAAGRAKVVAEYGRDVIIDRTLAAYRSLLQSEDLPR